MSTCTHPKMATRAADGPTGLQFCIDCGLTLQQIVAAAVAETEEQGAKQASLVAARHYAAAERRRFALLQAAAMVSAAMESEPASGSVHPGDANHIDFCVSRAYELLAEIEAREFNLSTRETHEKALTSGLVLKHGSHFKPEEGMSVMEAVAWLAHEPHSNYPVCACPVLAALMRRWNDALPDEERNRILKPFLLQLVGSHATPEVEAQRAYLALDWLIREHTVAWLRLAKLPKHADALAALDRIASPAAACAARGKVIDARIAAAATAAATRVGTPAAAWYATWSIAKAAARAAAGLATWSAALYVIDDPALYASECAAGAAGLVCCQDTAPAAAEDALRPMVVALQDSCVDLVRRMLAIR